MVGSGRGVSIIAVHALAVPCDAPTRVPASGNASIEQPLIVRRRLRGARKCQQRTTRRGDKTRVHVSTSASGTMERAGGPSRRRERKKERGAGWRDGVEEQGARLPGSPPPCPDCIGPPDASIHLPENTTRGKDFDKPTWRVGFRVFLQTGAAIKKTAEGALLLCTGPAPQAPRGCEILFFCNLVNCHVLFTLS